MYLFGHLIFESWISYRKQPLCLRHELPPLKRWDDYLRRLHMAYVEHRIQCSQPLWWCKHPESRLYDTRQKFVFDCHARTAPCAPLHACWWPTLHSHAKIVISNCRPRNALSILRGVVGSAGNNPHTTPISRQRLFGLLEVWGRAITLSRPSKHQHRQCL